MKTYQGDILKETYNHMPNPNKLPKIKTYTAFQSYTECETNFDSNMVCMRNSEHLSRRN
jgi:hypothetical protein